MKNKEEIKELVEYFENRKAYIIDNDKIKSKIIARSSVGDPAYFIRADFETGKDAKKTPLAYWQINNPFTTYFEGKRNKIENIKNLIKTEKKLDIPSHHSKYEYKKEKERYEFLTEIREVSEKEITERIQEGMIVFIK